ncbi:ribonucleoside-diphosphate reductase subunit alpha [Arenicella sp. 4NH20-0111]|uniref:ribonucleoside-diphosphate reductase subunit alpha n=1 Tax=Arenicella sp. 4NH20-0111 TaxID=3127648 RepID=UPI0031058F4C
MQHDTQLRATTSPDLAPDLTPDSEPLSSSHLYTSSSAPTSKPLIFVIKRDGNLVPYSEEKITLAISKAICASDTDHTPSSTSVIAEQISSAISQRLLETLLDRDKINIEDIQDQVELGLMRQGLQKVARAYVLYRQQRSDRRAKEQETHKSEGDEFANTKSLLAFCCRNLSDVSPETVYELARKNFYQGINSKDIATTLVMTLRPMIENEPNYSFVAARVLLHALKQEVSESLNIDLSTPNFYSQAFREAINHGLNCQLLDSRFTRFDLDTLTEALDEQYDLQFQFLGLQTLYDRYLLHWQQQRLELPQVFFMRVAMGLALNEEQPNERAIEFYRLLASFDYMASTPTLFNSGTIKPQLSSCYLTTVPDDLGGIYGSIKDNALLSKWAGGLGNDWTPVRALGARINGTNGQSQGVVPFLKVVNDTAVAVNQGGKRKGAVCAYLETWHLDIEDFLDLRKNTGDERRRTHDMNTSNWVPDLFMQRVFEDAQWTLFSPDDVPDLHELSGKAFVEKYQYYESLVERNEISLFKRVPASDLWRKMLSMLFETGHPWITFKDACNLRSPQQHSGVVHSSNLCTEITLNTSDDEIAVCNLGSINIAQHITNGTLDLKRLKRSVSTAIRALDNVIDINYYACPQSKKSNLRHRPIGLGMMGFQDALYKLEIPYASEEAVYFADTSMEQLSYYAIQASSELAKERGSYSSFQGSLWSQQILPIDSVELLRTARGAEYCTFNCERSLDWELLKSQISTHGMRNSNVMAIAPTATISNIVGVSQSIEPTYQNLYVKSNLSGEFTVVNTFLVDELKKLGLWSSTLVNELKRSDGSIRSFEGVPEKLKTLFAQAFEIDSHWLIEAAARRQKWIDQAQSLNLYMATPSGKQLDSLYKTAWSRGLKTTYYLRSLGATHMEKNLDQPSPQSNDTPQPSVIDKPSPPSICSILEPDCEACQ